MRIHVNKFDAWAMSNNDYQNDRKPLFTIASRVESSDKAIQVYYTLADHLDRQ